MKKIVALVLSLFLMMSASVVNASEIYYDDAWHTYEGNIFTLKVDGMTINCEVPPIVFNDYSVVPARDVFEAMGATVDWDAANQKVTVKYSGTKVELYINKRAVSVNGVEKTAPIPPKLINGKTMIPVRFVSEALGFSVDFDSSTDTILINTGKGVTNPTQGITLNKYTYSKTDGVTVAVFNFTNNVNHSSFMLQNPTRLVIDTKNTSFPSTIKSAQTGYDDVTGIRLGQHDEGVRIVFDMTQELDYEILALGKSLTVKIGNNIKDVPVEEGPVIPDPPAYAPSRTVYLDPGHGGEDPGAIHTDENGKLWRECDINLGVALKVREILQNNNVKVLMSRESDRTVALVDRPIDANNKEATLFVSVHTNSFVSDTAVGIETWGTLEYSATYCGITDKNLAQNIQNTVIKKTGGKSRGIKDSGTLAVLRHSIMPSVLIEVGFISNADERVKMFDESYRQKLAEGIAEGILKTLSQMGL